MIDKNKIKYFIGIDVQVKRGCYYVINKNKNFVTNGWFKEKIPESISKIIKEISENDVKTIAIGIDAPRMPIKNFRVKSYDKHSNSWLVTDDQKIGRECEVIIKSHGLGNPQWTRTLETSPEWMKVGYSIFKALKKFPYIYEVFPTSSYKMLHNENFRYELCLNNFIEGAKDMLDASVAAITVYEFINGKGCEVGGGDGLGTIVLPRKIGLSDKYD